MEIEFDVDKHLDNLRSRGLGFDYAALIFRGETIEREDDRRDYGEKRHLALGEVEGAILAVVYTERGVVRRIISARPASRKERRLWRSRG